ncbi:MAG: type 4a pilus biogenesis protein PilO [Candidatus Omnitrophota bacterium]
MIDITVPEKLKPYVDKVQEFLSDEQMRTYVIIGITVVIAALYLTFILVPRFGEMSKASRVVSDLNNKINQLNTRIKRQDKVKAQLNEFKEEYSGYAKRLPKEKEIPDFLEGLSGIAKTAKVKILSITPSGLKAVKSEGKEVKYYREMPILITAKSGFHQLGKFTSNLEKGKRFVTISNLRIQHDSAFPRMHNVRMQLKTYVSVE